MRRERARPRRRPLASWLRAHPNRNSGYSLNTISGCASEFTASDHTAAFSGTARAQDLGEETRRHAGTRCECLDWSDAARRPALHARPRPPAARALGRPPHSGSRKPANPPALAQGAPRRLQLRGYTAIGALYRPERTCGEGIACWTGFRRRCCWSRRAADQTLASGPYAAAAA